MSVIVKKHFKVKSGQLSFSLPKGVYSDVDIPLWVVDHPRFHASVQNRDIRFYKPISKSEAETKPVSVVVEETKEVPPKKESSFETDSKPKKTRGRKKKKTDDEEK